MKTKSIKLLKRRSHDDSMFGFNLKKNSRNKLK